MQIIWTTCPLASAIHAAACAADHRTVRGIPEPRTLEALLPIARGIDLELRQAIDTLPVQRGWSMLLEAGLATDDPQVLAQAFQANAMRRFEDPVTARRWAGWLHDLDAWSNLHLPKLAEQLELRARPIRDQWLGFGSGLTAHLRRLTEKTWIASEARVAIVHPMLGGYGETFPSSGRVLLEGVLTNPVPDLPEVVRLAWLLARLRSEDEAYAEPPPSGSDRSVSEVAIRGLAVSLACMVATLAAAEVMELARCDEATLDRAAELWQLGALPSQVSARCLIPWWETYLQTRPSWSLAITALQRRLESEKT